MSSTPRSARIQPNSEMMTAATLDQYLVKSDNQQAREQQQRAGEPHEQIALEEIRCQRAHCRRA